MKKKRMRIKRFNGKLLKSNQTLTILYAVYNFVGFIRHVCNRRADFMAIACDTRARLRYYYRLYLQNV